MALNAAVTTVRDDEEVVGRTASSSDRPALQAQRDPGILLTVEDLVVTVPVSGRPVDAVRGVSFEIAAGEAVGLVGESGSGKTLVCRSILGVLAPGCTVSSGAIRFAGRDLASLGRRQWQELRGGRIGAVFQDPASYLNPSLSVGSQLAEVLRVKAGLKRVPAKRRALELLEAMGLHRPEHVFHQLPGELSGGMLQRVMIACAVACEPDLVVADEATTALDVTTQAEVVELLRSLKREHGVSVLFVSHDLAVVAELCDRVVVFYAGEVVEIGTKDEIVGSPRHPYTEALLKVSALASGDRGALDVIPGQPPAIDEHRIGCRFAGRCPYEVERCSSTSVALRQVAPGRWSRCLRSDEHLVGGSASR